MKERMFIYLFFFFFSYDHIGICTLFAFHCNEARQVNELFVLIEQPGAQQQR